MDQDLQKQIDDLNRKMNEVYASVEKTRKYLMWTGIITLAVIVLPLIGMLFVVPSFLGNYTTTIETLGV